MAAHMECGIRLKAKKTFLFMKNFDYLGYKVSEDGIPMRPDYVDKIMKGPNPKNEKELRRKEKNDDLRVYSQEKDKMVSLRQKIENQQTAEADKKEESSKDKQLREKVGKLETQLGTQVK